tara:strand:+ start:1389 stop:1973 length:585 start_codon:yes stop_codon:yes gene_type:complete
MKIIENTFKNPYEIRKVALSLDYATSNSLKWPGYRVDLPEPIKGQYFSIIKKQFNDVVKIKHAYFQYIDESWISGSCHYDDSKYTCITFLNVNPQINSGLEIYDEKYCCPKTGKLIDIFDPTKKKFYSSEKNLIQKILFKQRLKRYNSQFKDPCVISNKFNRTIGFNSEKMHRAQDFFGTKKSNSRLTLVSFLV